jgi:Domain of unknown function (DUF222)/HNH endonuclease
MGAGGGLSIAVDEYCLSPVPCDSDALSEELVTLRRLIDRLEVRFSKVAARHIEMEVWDRDGCVSPIQWLRGYCHMATMQAVDRVHVGLQLEQLPQSVEALTAGEIGFTHLALIAETGLGEEALLPIAKEKDVTQFRHVCQHARHAADPEGYAQDSASEFEESFLELRLRGDGGAWLKGAVDREGAAALKQALGPLARRNGDDDHRTQEQRNAHALVELAHHALDSGWIPGRPHLQVTASFETLAGHCNSPAGELEFSLPICRATVERLGCDCSLTRVILDSDSMVIDVGRSKRIVNGSRARALRARDKGCRWPGCTRPASWTNAHHLVHWARGGTTDLDNLVLLCHRHHWMVHEGGWQLVKNEDGKLLAIPPMVDFYRPPLAAPMTSPPEPELISSA